MELVGIETENLSFIFLGNVKKDAQPCISTIIIFSCFLRISWAKNISQELLINLDKHTGLSKQK